MESTTQNQQIPEILIYPDHRLLTISKPVNEYGAAITDLGNRMNLAMLFERGLGLSAIQIGVPLRAFIVNKDAFKGISVPCFLPGGSAIFINPEIIEFSAGTETASEGCLSFPKVFGAVSRFKTVRIHALDVFANDFEIEASGLFARVLQHEIDHLDGKIFLSRLGPLARDIARRKLKKHKHIPPKKT